VNVDRRREHWPRQSIFTPPKSRFDGTPLMGRLKPLTRIVREFDN
jgi:hypothetical protein